MTTIESLTHFSDDQLTARILALAEAERRATAALIATLAEFDARRLYLAAGCSSLFTYCTQVLRLSEHSAYGRIEAARAARRFPVLLDLPADGALTLTAICLLGAHLTPENHQEVLASARHKTKREVELLVATIRPRPPVPATIHKLPTPKPVTTEVPGTTHEQPPRRRRQMDRSEPPSWPHLRRNSTSCRSPSRPKRMRCSAGRRTSCATPCPPATCRSSWIED